MNRTRPEVAAAGVGDGTESVSRRRVRWWRGVGLAAALALAFLTVAAIGAGEVHRGARVLASLEPVVAAIAGAGGGLTALVLAHPAGLGMASSVAAVGVALLGLIICRRRAVPLVLLAAAVLLVAWGQIALLADRAVAGMYLYGTGFVCAVGLGAWYPLTRLPGFPPWPFPGDPPAADRRRAWPTWELALVFGLTLLALLSRVYALPELPDTFDTEMSVSMLASGTRAGLRHYLPTGLLGVSTGVVHLFVERVFFHFLGTSVYAIRLVAVLFGVAAVPLCYWLARRIGGMIPALVATVLLVAAPEQLYWSRHENTHFAPIAVAALVTVHLGLWLSERVSVMAVLAAALWMPVCRFFYAPAMILFAYPLALYAHAVVCVRGAWRKGWYAVPLLAGGVAIWVLSVSIALASLNHWQWRFLNPAGAFAAAAWGPQGEGARRSLAEGVLQRAVSVADNVGRTATAMAYHAGFSQFYVRADPSIHPTMINVGVVVAVVLGLGYLLGQLCDRRAFALLLWVGLGVLPALLSDAPAGRRMSIIFPAFYVVVGVFVGAMARLVRLCAGRRLGRLTGALLAVAVVGVASSSLASFFLLPIRPLPADGAFHFTRPLFEGSDVIFHNFDGEIGAHILFGNLDAFLARPSCYKAVAPTQWLSVALRPRCEFTDELYEFMLPRRRIAALRAQPRRERISFLVNDQPLAHPHIELLRALYPHAPYRDFRSRIPEIQLVSLTISREDLQALHMPALLVGTRQPAAAELASRTLAGVTLAPSADATVDGLAVRGGLLIEQPGWYRFAIDPPCARATLTIDERQTAERQPLLAGVHRFALQLPDAAACPLPVRLLVQSQAQPQPVPMPPEAIVSPAVAAVPGAQAPAVMTYEGYGEARQFVQPAGRILDFGVDAEGTVFVLVQEHERYRVVRFSPAAVAEASWEPQGAQGYAVVAIAVAPDGRVLLRGEYTVWAFDRDGHPVWTWDSRRVGSADIAVLADGRNLSCHSDRNAVAVVDGEGRLQAEWGEFKGGPGSFNDPVSVAANRQGDILVIESAGQALLFHSEPGEFKPQYVRSFPIAFRGLPLSPHGVAFEDGTRILLPEADSGTLVYDLDGRRLMAAAPARDLNTRGFGFVVRYQVTAERLYVLDEARRLWVIAR